MNHLQCHPAFLKLLRSKATSKSKDATVHLVSVRWGCRSLWVRCLLRSMGRSLNLRKKPTWWNRRWTLWTVVDPTSNLFWGPLGKTCDTVHQEAPRQTGRLSARQLWGFWACQAICKAVKQGTLSTWANGPMGNLHQSAEFSYIQRRAWWAKGSCDCRQSSCFYFPIG